MADGYQSRQSDGLWYWGTTHKVAWIFDHMNICSTFDLMANNKHYISNSTSPMDTKIDRVMACDIEPPFKKSYHLKEKVISIHRFFSTPFFYSC